MTFRRPPLPGKDLGAWARQMYEYMSSQSPVQGSVDPTPLLLAHLVDGQMARAATDGVIMFDPVAGEVVVSIGGAFVTLGPVAAFTLPDIITAGSAGDADSVPQITVDAKGRVTALSQIDVSIAAAKINDSTAAGRSMLLAADAAAQTALLNPFTSLLKGLVPASGSDTQLYLRADGSWAAAGPRLQTAIIASGQTTLPFTGIPTWANRVDVILSLISTNGIDNMLVQVGDGAYATTGYLSSYQAFTGGSTGMLTSTAGFLVHIDSAANQQSGVVTLHRQSGNKWVATGIVRRNGSSLGFTVGEVALTGALDRVRLNTVGGTQTFDGGSVSVSWE